MRSVLALVLCCAGALSALGPGSGQASQPIAPALTIDNDAAIATIFIKPDKVAVFEDVVGKLRASLQKSGRQGRREQAAGWQVFRSLDVSQGNVTYIMRMEPVVRGQEYDVTRLIAETFPDDILKINMAYRDAQAGRAMMTMDRVRLAGLGDPADPASSAPEAIPAVTPLMSFEKVDAALITVLVTPERTADFESTLALLGRALQASVRPGRKRQAAGWKIFKSTQLINGSVPYVMSLDPIQPRTEYDVIRLIQETYPADVAMAFEKYRGSFVGQAIVRLGDRIDLSK